MDFLKSNSAISSCIDEYEDAYNYFVNAYSELLMYSKKLNIIEYKKLQMYLKQKNNNLINILNHFEEKGSVVYKISDELATILKINNNYNYTEQDMSELIKIYEQKLIEHYGTKEEDLVDILTRHIKRVVLI
jgi:hypothetical protein